MDERRLERCRRWLTFSRWWRVPLIIGLAIAAGAISLVTSTRFSGSGHLFSDGGKSQVLEIILLMPMAILGLCLTLWIDRLVLLWVKRPIREALTSTVVGLAQKWTVYAHEAAAQELVLRAQVGDPMAKDYVFGRPVRLGRDLTGQEIPRPVPWGEWFPATEPKPIKLWNPEQGFHRVVDVYARRRRQLRFGAIGLVPMSVVLEGLEEHFERVNRALENTFSLLGFMAIFLIPFLWNAADPDESVFEKDSVRQIVFAYIRCPGAIRKAAKTALRVRAQTDAEAKGTCLRLGIYTRDPGEPDGIREAI